MADTDKQLREHCYVENTTSDLYENIDLTDHEYVRLFDEIKSETKKDKRQRSAQQRREQFGEILRQLQADYERDYARHIKLTHRRKKEDELCYSNPRSALNLWLTWPLPENLGGPKSRPSYIDECEFFKEPEDFPNKRSRIEQDIWPSTALSSMPQSSDSSAMDDDFGKELDIIIERTVRSQGKSLLQEHKELIKNRMIKMMGDILNETAVYNAHIERHLGAKHYYRTKHVDWKTVLNAAENIGIPFNVVSAARCLSTKSLEEDELNALPVNRSKVASDLKRIEAYVEKDNSEDLTSILRDLNKKCGESSKHYHIPILKSVREQKQMELMYPYPRCPQCHKRFHNHLFLMKHLRKAHS
ncbi:uncharacterized protein VTP21DRAFT_8372 [Calcarisporiella thermophila]|uniref:uncharacterized protein n=1 Tax=Calcarisporiella thermophila TaxID=911321 RepID=UPI003744A667